MRAFSWLSAPFSTRSASVSTADGPLPPPSDEQPAAASSSAANSAPSGRARRRAALLIAIAQYFNVRRVHQPDQWSAAVLDHSAYHNAPAGQSVNIHAGHGQRLDQCRRDHDGEVAVIIAPEVDEKREVAVTDRRY